MVKALIRKHDILFCVLIAAADCALMYLLRAEEWWMALFSWLLALLYILLFQFVSGREVRMDTRGLARGVFRFGWPLLVSACLLLIFNLAFVLWRGGSFALPNDASRVLGVIGFKLCINGREEIVYRLLLFGFLFTNRGGGTKAALRAGIVSAVLFALVHMVDAFYYGNFAAQFVNAVSAGCCAVLLVGVFYRSGNMWAVILLHAAYNLIAYDLYPFFLAEGSTAIPRTAEAMGIANVIGYLLTVAMALWYVVAGLRLLRGAPAAAWLERAGGERVFFEPMNPLRSYSRSKPVQLRKNLPAGRGPRK